MAGRAVQPLQQRAEKLMSDGGSLLTVSFYGADRVVENYNLMGPVKAALESSVRYLAADLAAAAIQQLRRHAQRLAEAAAGTHGPEPRVVCAVDFCLKNVGDCSGS